MQLTLGSHSRFNINTTALQLETRRGADSLVTTARAARACKRSFWLSCLCTCFDEGVTGSATCVRHPKEEEECLDEAENYAKNTNTEALKGEGGGGGGGGGES